MGELRRSHASRTVSPVFHKLSALIEVVSPTIGPLDATADRVAQTGLGDLERGLRCLGHPVPETRPEAMGAKWHPLAAHVLTHSHIREHSFPGTRKQEAVPLERHGLLNHGEGGARQGHPII